MRGAQLPPPVHSGDVVGIAALSSPPDTDALETGLRQLEALGFRVRVAHNLSSKRGLFAGDDEARVGGFHDLVEDAEVRAVFFARGGHGVLRLLPAIDWALMRAHPKAYVGYSDLTPLLLQIVQRIGLTCFHGPMIATDLSSELTQGESDSLLRALHGEIEGVFQLAEKGPGQEAEGILLGGCLSLLVATLGTAFSPDLAGSLLFLEDVQEPLYRLDRMLTQLRLSGSLDRVKGMILGYLEASDADGHGTESVLEMVGEAHSGPVGWGLACGHGRPNLTLPLGARARLCPAEGVLRVLPVSMTDAGGGSSRR